MKDRIAHLESEHALTEPDKHAMSESQAQAICRKYSDTYLIKRKQTPSESATSVNVSFEDIIYTCVKDLTSTGNLMVSSQGDILVTRTKDAKR